MRVQGIEALSYLMSSTVATGLPFPEEEEDER